MAELTNSSLLQFISSNSSSCSQSEIRSSLLKAEKCQEFRLTDAHPILPLSRLDSNFKDPALFFLDDQIYVESNRFFSEELITFLKQPRDRTNLKSYVWELCAFLEKNTNITIPFEDQSPTSSTERDNKFLSIVSLISHRKFLYEVFNLPYDSKKERKSLLSDTSVKLRKEDTPHSLKNYPLQTFKPEHLICNYDNMFSSLVFLLLIIQHYLTGKPIIASFEQQNSKNVLEEKKMSSLYLLKKWIKLRPKVFSEERINYNVAVAFLKYLKKNEVEERILKMVGPVLKLLESCRSNGLSNSSLHINYLSNKGMSIETVRDHFSFHYNQLSFKEVARILYFLDLKMFIKINFFELDNNKNFKVCDDRIKSLSRFFELNFSSQRKNENKIVVLTNYFELARFLYQEKNYFSLYILIIAMLSKSLESFFKDNLKSIEKYYINAAKDLNFYKKLYSDSFGLLKDKLNHHQNEKCPCIPLFKLYQRELFLIEKKFSVFEKKNFLVIEKLLHLEKHYQQISCFKRLLTKQAALCYQGFTKNDDYYFLKSNYEQILIKVEEGI